MFLWRRDVDLVLKHERCLVFRMVFGEKERAASALLLPLTRHSRDWKECEVTWRMDKSKMKNGRLQPKSHDDLNHIIISPYLLNAMVEVPSKDMDSER